MAEQKLQEVETSASFVKARGFWERFQRPLIAAGIAIILIAVAYVAYKKLYKEPAEERAADAIFKAEEYFRNDSLRLALNGDGVNKGFLGVIKNNDGTKAANLAHFYAGICYLRLNDFNNAVKYLKDFDTDGQQIQMIAYGRLADAYAELNKKEDAVSYYQKAGRYFEEDEFNSSEFLFRAAYLLESMGKNDDALEIYKELKQKYPKTEKGFSADKYIYRLSVEKNEFSVK